MVGRLAPTPSGALHVGNAVAFAGAWLSARSQGGRILLRMEDIDPDRSRTDIADSQRGDLDWLGLGWDAETPAQSRRDYSPWLNALEPHVYRCTCTRREIREAGGIYRGTCRERGLREGAVRLRLPGGDGAFTDRCWGHQRVAFGEVADPILVTRVGNVAYPLAVVVDDIVDGVTEVVRGSDLLSHTPVQMQLWRHFGATPPAYQHTPLILGPDGSKLSKSHAATSIADLRAAGWSARDVWRATLPWLGIPDVDRLEEAISLYHPANCELGPFHWHGAGPS